MSKELYGSLELGYDSEKDFKEVWIYKSFDDAQDGNHKKALYCAEVISGGSVPVDCLSIYEVKDGKQSKMDILYENPYDEKWNDDVAFMNKVFDACSEVDINLSMTLYNHINMIMAKPNKNSK